MNALLAGFVDIVSKSTKLALVLLFLAVSHNTYQINEISNVLHSQQKVSSTEYAYDVLAFGLRNAPNDESIVDTVKKWKAGGWSAQMGAIRTICDNHPMRLDALMSENAKRLICRMAG